MDLGGRIVLDDVSVSLSASSRLGVIGPNGVGKTSLLRALAGDLPLSGGRLIRSPSVRIMYLRQLLDAPADESVGSYLRRRTGLDLVEAVLDETQDQLGDGGPAEVRYWEALERFGRLGGGEFDSRMARASARVGLGDVDIARPVGTLSGGQRSRLMLALLDLQRFDVLLLDEPTNNLDLDGLEILTRIVASTSSGVVAVTHNREFLDHCMHQILSMDESTRRATLFTGNWTDFVADRARHARGDRARNEEAARVRLRLEQQLERNRRQAGGVGGGPPHSTDGDKMARDWRANRAGRGAGERIKALERRIDRISVAEVDEPDPLEFSLSSRTTGRPALVELRSAVVQRGEFRLGPVDLTIGRNERLAVLGPNGAGKTTLLRLLGGSTEPVSGTRTVAPDLQLGIMVQDPAPPGSSQSLFEWAGSIAKVDEEDLRQALSLFGIARERQTELARLFSPGERTRACLAVLTLTPSPLLILDEPTNHLDIEAVEQLERALSHYEGALVVASHDVWFLRTVAPQWVVEVATSGMVTRSDAPQGISPSSPRNADPSANRDVNR